MTELAQNQPGLQDSTLHDHARHSPPGRKNKGTGGVFLVNVFVLHIRYFFTFYALFTCTFTHLFVYVAAWLIGV